MSGNYSLTFSCSFKRRMNHWYEGRSREACHLLAAGCCHAVRSVTSHRVASDSALRLWVVRKKTVMWADCQLEMESSASESPCAGTGKELHPLLWRPSVCWDNDIKDSPLCCWRGQWSHWSSGWGWGWGGPHVWDRKLLKLSVLRSKDMQNPLCCCMYGCRVTKTVAWSVNVLLVLSFLMNSAAIPFRIGIVFINHLYIIKCFRNQNHHVCLLYNGWTDHFHGCRFHQISAFFVVVYRNNFLFTLYWRFKLKDVRRPGRGLIAFVLLKSEKRNATQRASFLLSADDSCTGPRRPSVGGLISSGQFVRELSHKYQVDDRLKVVHNYINKRWKQVWKQ